MGRPKPAFRITLDGAGRLEDLPISEVADLLRGIAQVIANGADRGEVTYDDSEKRARSIRVAEVLTGSQLDLGDLDFWEATSLDQLVDEQGTGVIADPERLVLDGITEPEWDAFYAAVSSAG